MMGFGKSMRKQKDSILELTFPGLGHGRGEGVNEGVNLSFEGVSEELNDLLRFIESNPGKKVKDISKVLNKGVSTVERYIKILKGWPQNRWVLLEKKRIRCPFLMQLFETSEKLLV